MDERIEKLKPLVAAIGAALWPGSAIPESESTWIVELINTENPELKLCFHFSGSYHDKYDKIEVSGSYTGLRDFLPSNHDRSTIGVSSSKDPETIARDIERRLMPGYLDTIKRAKEIKARHDNWTGRRKAIETRMIKILPALERGQYLRENQLRAYGPYYLELQISALSNPDEPGERDTVDLTVRSISPEMAEKILTIIQNS